MSIYKKKCIIFDMDGTVYLGKNPIIGTVDWIKRNWKIFDIFFLSNNTSKSISTYVNILNTMGILVEEKNILSPITPLVEFLRENNILSVYIVGNSYFKDDIKKIMPEISINNGEYQAVILAYDTDLTYQKLVDSAILLQNKEIRFFATHPDNVCPSPEGFLPDVGSFLALYKTSTGRDPEYIFGKPDKNVLKKILKEYNSSEIAIVGDRLSTDKKLAENVGADFIAVLSGEATLSDIKKEEIQPWMIIHDFGDIKE